MAKPGTKRDNASHDDDEKKWDFDVKLAFRANTKRATRVGVGFYNPNNSISIKLNPGIVISFRDLEDHWLTLWPTNKN